MPSSQTLEFPVPVLRVGEVFEIAPGVHWLRMRLPFRLNHVNVWILEDGDDVSIVDTGMNMPESRDTWQGTLSGAFAFRKVSRVIGTHFHSDHTGLAAWLCETYGAPLWMTQAEWNTARILGIDRSEAFLDTQLRFYRALGYDAGQMDRLAAAGNAYAQKVLPVPPTYHRLRDGAEFPIGGRIWRVIAAAGHSPEMACLYCAELGILISGDHVLPSITPNVSVFPAEPDADPLTDFLGSFAPFLALPADTLVLPSHGRPFRGLAARIRQVEAHHGERLQRVADACVSPLSINDLLDVLFEPGLSDHERIVASGEALAHARHLEFKKVLRSLPGEDGVLRFVLA